MVVGIAAAKDFGGRLTAAGFVKVEQNRVLQPGDVAVIQAVPGHRAGHACIWDGHEWISDFRQEHGMYPATEYRLLKASFVIYRHP